MAANASLPPFQPKVTPAQANAIITAPGSPLETHQVKLPFRDSLCPPLKAYKNLPPTMRAVFFGATAAFADRAYLKLYSGNPRAFDEEAARGSLRTVTYAQAKEEVVRLMWALKGLGVKKGDKVAVCSKNSIEWALWFWAATSIGAVLVAVNSWLLARELHYCIDLADVKILLADDERLERLLTKQEDGSGSYLDALFKGKLEKVFVTGSIPKHGFGAKVAPYGDLVAQPGPSADPPEASIAEDDEAVILFTSGTTGFPKGAVQTHRGALTNIFTMAALPLRGFLRRGEAPPAPVTEQRASLIGTPMFHVGGLHCNLIPNTLAGSLVIIMSRWDAGVVLDIAVKHKLTGLGGVPYQSLTLLSHPKLLNNPELLARIESVGGGGAPAPKELVETVERLLPKVDKRWVGDGYKGLNGYGLTETNGFVIMNAAEDYFIRQDSIGLASPVNEVVIAPTDLPPGALTAEPPISVPLGTIGEIWVRGVNVMKEYYKNPKATAETITPTGWLRTGDLGTMDSDGFVRQLDRAKDVLIRAGENIYSVEVEDAIMLMPGVEEAAVVGVPHPRLGEEVAAIVKMKDGYKADAEAVIRHCQSRIAQFKVPTYVHFKTESLPKNATQKVLKKDLKTEVVALLKEGKLGINLPPAKL
ncbi:hypothetical protein DFJ74DRAFT_676337 [Hyaloraphidium curvatum]|nr:hypothetical protein DFJ74DRAFT_676337 [Hyaloraphidium curvatum]